MSSFQAFSAGTPRRGGAGKAAAPRQVWLHVDPSQSSPIGPNLIEIPTAFKLCKVGVLDLLDVLRAASLSMI